MTTESNNPSRRTLLAGMAALPAIAALGGTAASAALPIGDEAKWSRLVANYRCLRAASQHESQRGALARATADYEAGLAPIDTVHRAEERHKSSYDVPVWEAYDALLAAPAPTLAALLEKVEIIEIEEAGLHDPDEGPGSVFADVRRLLKREG